MTSIGWYGERAKPAKKEPSNEPFSHLTKVVMLFSAIIVSGAAFSGLSFAVLKVVLG